MLGGWTGGDPDFDRPRCDREHLARETKRPLGSEKTALGRRSPAQIGHDSARSMTPKQLREPTPNTEVALRTEGILGLHADVFRRRASSLPDLVQIEAETGPALIEFGRLPSKCADIRDFNHHRRRLGPNLWEPRLGHRPRWRICQGQTAAARVAARDPDSRGRNCPGGLPRSRSSPQIRRTSAEVGAKLENIWSKKA